MESSDTFRDIKQIIAAVNQPIFAAINAYIDTDRNSKLNIRVGTPEQVIEGKPFNNLTEQHKLLFEDFAKRSKPGDMALIDDILYVRKSDD